jgi:hypothetical protein
MLSWLNTGYQWLRHGSPLKADETALLFPQSATRADDGSWTVPLHIWVVELERGTLSRRLGQRAVLELLDLADVVDDEQALTDNFKERIIWFVADREMNKRFKVKLDQQTFSTPRSPITGHIKFTAHYTGDAAPGSILPYRLASELADDMAGQVQLVPEQGLSIVSDIDDTIKISHVPDRRRLVKGIFFDDSIPAPGMAAWYRQLADAGCCFHYVSASPWQLYPTLNKMRQQHFPFGSFSLRHFYVGDETFLEFFASSREYKLDTIRQLLARFAQRQFALVGDSGQEDPEVYTQIAIEHPQQVAAILIRRVPIESYTDDTTSDQLDKDNQHRWQQLREQLPAGIIFDVFDHPDELPHITEQLIRLSADNRVLFT